jgi:hypothetical protein
MEHDPPAPDPAKARRIRRAHQAVEDLARLDRILLTDGVDIWFDHRDPANPSSLKIPGTLCADLRELRPELIELLQARDLVPREF